ncbi:putative RNA-binding [Hyphodiscus hymeniophilus]|uniref:U4/U6 snRNA-associated-splicing factor PRP24 n=1 Tax=Hyphodiscus hymeniophilus TaxID=353542 RepID=A0A9P7B0F8_9HELO|nr:putative RNA-binding [Hyphodiscus hymeniophilus]
MTETPLGEDSWLALVDEASRTASNLEQRAGVVELYKQAITAVPSSTKLWLAYCEWVWSLHTDCQTADAGWPEEEQIYGQELFSIEVARNVWQQGAQATKYRLNDSHELWNRWMSIELDQLSKSKGSRSAEQQEMECEYVRRIFMDRLQVPHSTWDDTSQMFSTFLSNNYGASAYETSMVEVTALAKNAKKQYEDRETSEIKLRRATESGDKNGLKVAMKAYLKWEVKQAKLRKKHLPVSPLDLCMALYERALSSTTILGKEPAIWMDYIVFLSRTKRELANTQLPSVLSVIQRSVTHCPWSGPLWSRYILRAEAEKLPHSDIELIKHAATDNKALDRDGMESVVDVYVAWCGYLKRRTLVQGATEDDMDVAEMGLRSALESVRDWGRKHDKNYKGDPFFRIERIFIQLLTQKGSIHDAREFWKRLISAHASSYEFWQQYYLWEITVRIPNAPPTLATEVLIKAIHQESLDWPEKMSEVYVRHCINFAESEALDVAMDIVHERNKAVTKRREKEREAADAYYAQQQPVPSESAVVETPSAVKRKRETDDGGHDDSASKKSKSDQPEVDHEALREQTLKRDRENTSVLVTGFPPEVTQTKIRQYFKEYGHVNSLSLKVEGEGDEKSTSALIEFRSNEDVQSALIRDGKYFTNSDRRIRVQSASGLTLYVTNFPPEADDRYFHDLFRNCGPIFSIRWPSLKYNAHRRFCYISFRTAEGAVAATQLNGLRVKGGHKLSVVYSNPSGKKAREGALAEGREIHVTSLDTNLTEDDVREVFAKYGTVESVRMMKARSGENTGAAFVIFEKGEEAEKSLDLDKTKLKSKILNVEAATGKNFKPIATSKGASASPAPDGDSVMPTPPAAETAGDAAGNAYTRDEIVKRTITLMNVPDTVNDSRIRALVEPFGSIVKVVLRPDHQGAIIEYVDIASAGRAALALENHEIVPGRNLRTGGMKDLFKEKDEIKTNRIQVGQGKKASALFIKPSAPVRRPGAVGRGGLGQRRGFGYSAPKTADSSTPSAGAGVNGKAKEEPVRPKSNADFKAMFVSGTQE